MSLTQAEIAKVVTLDALKELAPKAKPSLLQALVADCPRVFHQYGIDAHVKIWHFFGQIMRETGGLKRLDEDLYYTKPDRLRQIWKKFREMPEDELQTYLKNPQRLANFIYAGRNGNGDEASGDGWAYRGSGLIQLTGRGNFKKVGGQIGYPIVEDPALVREEGTCVEIAVAYWKCCAMNDVAIEDSGSAVDLVTKRVNPGEDEGGRAERRAFFDRAQQIMTA
jgi:putative chitinase